MENETDLPAKIIDRITLLSNALELNFDRLLSWIFLRIIISAQWFVEDNGDPSFDLVLAKHVYPLLENTKFSDKQSSIIRFHSLKEDHLVLLNH